MSSRLDSKPQIWTLAADLGLTTSKSPSHSILQFVTNRIRRIARKFHAASLNDLLIATAGEVETTFEEIRSDRDLQQVRLRYLSRGEKAFANLERELRWGRGLCDYDQASPAGGMGTTVCFSDRLQRRQGFPELLFEMA